MLQNAVTSERKVSVLSGPVLDDNDPQYRGVALPLQYWKIVAMVRKDGKPSVTGYLLSQESYIATDPLERSETTGLPRELVKLEHILL